MKTLLMIVALELAGSGPPVTLLDVHDAFERVARVASERGTHMTLSYETLLDGAPLASTLDRDGNCHVAFSATSESLRVVGGLAAGLSSERRTAFLEAVFAHELGHCEQFLLARKDFSRSELVDPDKASQIRSYAELKSAWGDPGLSVWVELLADVAASLYLNRTHPDQCRPVMQSLLRNREKFAGRDTGHATARYFHDQPVCFEAAPGEAPIDAAIRIRADLVRQDRAAASAQSR